jgi:hypothetical protein
MFVHQPARKQELREGGQKTVAFFGSRVSDFCGDSTLYGRMHLEREAMNLYSTETDAAWKCS